MLKKVNHTASSSSSYHDLILKLIEDCRNEPNKDKRIEILNQINSMLLRSDQVAISSQIINEHVNLALHKVERKLLLLAGSKYRNDVLVDILHYYNKSSLFLIHQKYSILK